MKFPTSATAFQFPSNRSPASMGSTGTQSAIHPQILLCLYMGLKNNKNNICEDVKRLERYVQIKWGFFIHLPFGTNFTLK